MNQKTRSILVVILWIFSGTIFYNIFSEPEIEKPKQGNYVDAVVECQEVVTSRLKPVKANYNNAFKYKGTKELIDGVKFQVSGRVNNKPYGCIVHYRNDRYIVEVIL